MRRLLAENCLIKYKRNSKNEWFVLPEDTKAVKNNQIITNGTVENCEEIKYDFRLGENILKSSFRRSVKFSELTVEEKSKCSIAPGEVVFVVTEEKLNLPNNFSPIK